MPKRSHKRPSIGRTTCEVGLFPAVATNSNVYEAVLLGGSTGSVQDDGNPLGCNQGQTHAHPNPSIKRLT